MKYTIAYTTLALSLIVPPVLSGQASDAAYGTDSAYGGGAQSVPVREKGRYTLNHVDLGVFADYFRFSPGGNSSTNFVGPGGRIAFSVHPNLALEGEMSYDFARNYSSTYTTGSGTTTTTTFVISSVRPLTGLFGPRLQFGTSGPFRIFATGKVGFVDFSTSSKNSVTGGQFTGAVAGIGGSGTYLAFYPGGGFEAFFGPVGLRAEAGDEIYMNNGAWNNLRVSAGPTIRF
jgi:hypothetical protein